MTQQKYDHRSKKVLVTGMSGTGKTTKLEELVRKEKARWKFVYDSQGEFSERFKVPPIYTEKGLLEATAKGGWVCFDPIETFDSDPDEGLLWFSEFVFTVSRELRGRKLFIIDELDDLTEDVQNPKPLLRVTRLGRRLEIDFFAITQGTNSLHNRIRQQITEIYAFAQGDANSTKWLMSRGMNEETLLNLRPGEYCYKNRNSFETQKGGKAF